MSDTIYRNVAMTGTYKLRNASGALFDPTSETLFIVQPGGSKVAVTPTNTGTGLRAFTFTPTEAGRHRAEAEGVTAGAVVARGRGVFYVTEEQF